MVAEFWVNDMNMYLKISRRNEFASVTQDSLPVYCLGPTQGLTSLALYCVNTSSTNIKIPLYISFLCPSSLYIFRLALGRNDTPSKKLSQPIRKRPADDIQVRFLSFTHLIFKSTVYFT